MTFKSFLGLFIFFDNGFWNASLGTGQKRCSAYIVRQINIFLLEWWNFTWIIPRHIVTKGKKTWVANSNRKDAIIIPPPGTGTIQPQRLYPGLRDGAYHVYPVTRDDLSWNLGIPEYRGLNFLFKNINFLANSVSQCAIFASVCFLVVLLYKIGEDQKAHYRRKDDMSV